MARNALKVFQMAWLVVNFLLEVISRWHAGTHHNGWVAWIIPVSCKSFQEVSEMDDGGDADAKEEEVEGAHHVCHACGMRGQ